MAALGTLAMLISFWGALEQILKLRATKSAGDLSRLTILLWVVALAIFFVIAWKTNSDSIFLWNYGLNTVMYSYMLYLVDKYQGQYRLPLSRKHLKVFKGGKEKPLEGKKQV